MGGRTIYPAGLQHKAERFSSSSTFVVPTAIDGDTIYVTGCAGGSGGNSGSAFVTTTSPGDYANGGGGGMSCYRYPLSVTPGETLTYVIGAGGVGGVAVSRGTSGSVNGNVGAAGNPTYITRSAVTIMHLWWAAAPTWATAGKGAAITTELAAGITNGGNGGDDIIAAESVGCQSAGSEASDASSAKGGHGGGASASGAGGNGGDAATDPGVVTATDGADGLVGAGGGGGGSAYASGVATATSGAGGDGGDGELMFEWFEPIT